MEYIKNIKRELETDVAVIGGGTAGVFAAVSSARTGAKTMLVEKNGILGGTMTMANVNFPGLFFAWGKQIITGPCWESVERTVKLGGAAIPKISFKPERHWYEQISLNKFVYISVLFEMCKESGIDLRCNTMVADVKETKDGVELVLCDKEGLLVVKAKKAIDATGDGNLCCMAGFEVEKSEVQQPATMQNRITGYDVEKVCVEDLKEKIANANLSEDINPSLVMQWLKGGKINMHVYCKNADTSVGRTELEIASFEKLRRLYEVLRTVKGLETFTISFISDETGVRETNRVVGKTVITAEDYIAGKMYEDSVCYAFYPVDLHVMHGIEQTFHKENVVSKVPYSALIPKNSKHILCAGRCISSDKYANSALRVEAVCMATGQATGCAAAIAALETKDVECVEYASLCNALEKIGATVPKE